MAVVEVSVLARILQRLDKPIGTVDPVADTETSIKITLSNTVGFVIFDAPQRLPVKQEPK